MHCICVPKRFIKQSMFTLTQTWKLDIVKAVRNGRATQKSRSQTPRHTPRFHEPMIMIHDRPENIDTRTIPRHWEGDLILRAGNTGNKSTIGTLLEPSTCFTILLHLPNHSRNPLLRDQDCEIALHSKISTRLRIDVYFSDPHSPCQQATNKTLNKNKPTKQIIKLINNNCSNHH